MLEAQRGRYYGARSCLNRLICRLTFIKVPFIRGDLQRGFIRYVDSIAIVTLYPERAVPIGHCYMNNGITSLLGKQSLIL
jgi:hypothetical protein